MGPVRIRHSSHHFGWQSSHSVDLAGWQIKMASIEIWIPWRTVESGKNVTFFEQLFCFYQLVLVVWNTLGAKFKLSFISWVEQNWHFLWQWSKKLLLTHLWGLWGETGVRENHFSVRGFSGHARLASFYSGFHFLCSKLWTVADASSFALKLCRMLEKICHGVPSSPISKRIKKGSSFPRKSAQFISPICGGNFGVLQRHKSTVYSRSFDMSRSTDGVQ